MMRSFGVLSLGLAVALCGCATVQSMHSRLVRAPNACVDQTVQIYFEPLSAELTPEGRAVLDASARGARSCRVRAVEVLGLADARGAQSSQANLALSERRARAVSAALAADGLPPANFVGAAGSVGAMTPEGERNPIRRRVDITLRLASR